MGLQVLIVDDSAVMRQIIKRVVGLSGYDVDRFIEAENGKVALEMLSSEWVDIILLDVHMPEMDGITFLKHIRKEDLYEKLPVVLVTTEARQQTLDEAISLGVRAHVKKPFKPESIRDVLDDILGDEYVRNDEVSSEGCDF